MGVFSESPRAHTYIKLIHTKNVKYEIYNNNRIGSKNKITIHFFMAVIWLYHFLFRNQIIFWIVLYLSLFFNFFYLLQ